MKKICFSSALALAVLSNVTHVSAQTVTLESFDSEISLTGELLSFEDGIYNLRTSIGIVQLGSDVVSCNGDGCPGANKNFAVEAFNVSGSASINEQLMPALVSMFAESAGASPTIKSVGQDTAAIEVASSGGSASQILVKSAGSTRALEELGQRGADLAVTTRAVRQAEQTVFSDLGFGDISTNGSESIMALDGLMIVTAPENAVRAITEENIARVFAGQVTNWADLGGRNGPIQVYVRSQESGTGSVFFEKMMAPTGRTFVNTAVVVQTDRELAEAVANDPSAIGFTSFSTVGDTRALGLRGVCGLQTPANAFTIKTEEYPLTRRLYTYSDAKNENVAEFVDFIGSDAAQAVVAEKGFVDLGVSSQPINAQGLRFAASILPTDAEVTLAQTQSMVRELIAAERLSLTFRFDNASSRLDTRARSDIGRLVEMMSGSQLENKEVILVGYTDSVVPGANNQLLSQQRSAQVLSALVAELPTDRAESARIKTIGYGEMSPLGCNETDNGRRINRRVEVWVKDIIDG